jgi:hypothetical protein
MKSPGAGELAMSFAIMHATLECTTDAILVTDEANYVRHFVAAIRDRALQYLRGTPPPDDCSVLKVSLLLSSRLIEAAWQNRSNPLASLATLHRK